MLPAFESGYLDHLRVERGLADSSLVAYARELERLAAWSGAQGKSALELKQQDVSEFI